jgi:integrase
MTAGHIQRRGKYSWRLKFEGPRDPETRQRNMQYLTVRGTKAEAKVKLAELVAAVGNSTYVEPSKLTVAEHVRARVEQWEAAYDAAGKTGISPKTTERYRELVENQIVPHIGAKPVQKLRPLDIEAWQITLRTKGRKGGESGVSTRTIKHAHRILSHALDDAVKNDLVVKNVARIEGAPQVDDTEVQVVPKERIGELIDKLRGRAMYARGITALFTGLRRGEILAPRWHHIDLDAKVMRVREALEETKGRLVVKAPKTKVTSRVVCQGEGGGETLGAVFVHEDGEQDALHGSTVLEGAHRAGAAANLAEASFDGIGGAHGLARREGRVTEAGQQVVEVSA